MKYLVDTCGWIEWISSGKLSHNFAKYLSNTDHLVVSTINQYELYKWICREKNTILALEIIGVTEQCHVIPINTTIALDAVDFSQKYHLAMADALIYATAQSAQVTIITCDQHFKDLPNVEYFVK